MSEVFSLASVYGAPKTTVEINSQFDFLGKTTVLVGHQSISYPPIADDLVEKPITKEEGDWLGWTANIAIGVLVTAACVAVAVIAAPAAVVMIAGCAAVGAAAATIAVAVEDYNGGKPKPRATGEALQEVAIGLTRGAITGAVFYYAAPVGFWETVGVGMYDGFLGSFVEQCLRGKVLEPDTLEKGIEDAIVEGATCGLFWGAGKILGKLADRFGGWLEEVGKSSKYSNLLDELAGSGVKCNIDDVVAITKTADGKLVWLEKGNSKAGLEHIMQHADQFATQGISDDKISDFIVHALKNGKVVGTQRTRTIYEVMYEGKLQRVAISVGDNGFIVGANPKSVPK